MEDIYVFIYTFLYCLNLLQCTDVSFVMKMNKGMNE